MSKTNKKNDNDNTMLALVLAALGLGGVGLAVWARSRSSEAGSSSSSSSSSSGANGAKAPTLAEVASTLRTELLTLDGCSVAWKLGEASRSALLVHQADFFTPAIADARAKGLTTVDEITSHVAGLLVPGCPWPPPIIEDFDIQAAVSGQLSALKQQMWNIAQTAGSVQLYLTIRSAVASSLITFRRG